jgi:hypothetical protein
MFETVIAAMLKHKQIVFAAIAVTALSGLVLAPVNFNQAAQAQDGREIAQSVLDSVFGGDNAATDTGTEEDDDNGNTAGDDVNDIDQEQTQSNEQDQSADQDVSQSNSQDETNVQANELDTGDNTATVAQSNREDQDVDADADVSDSSATAASQADAEDDDHIKVKAKKSHVSVSDSDTTSAESQADAIISATAEATGIQGDQSNTADVDQDSSIHDVDLSNNVAFGDDTNTQVAIPIIDQDQRAANLAEQRAANLDVEENVFPYGFTSTSTTTTGGTTAPDCSLLHGQPFILRCLLGQ